MAVGPVDREGPRSPVGVEGEREGEHDAHPHDGAGHAFFDWSRASYRPEQCMDAWKKVFAFYNKHLS